MAPTPFPRAADVQPVHDGRRAPAVAEDEVPPDLRTVPGAERDKGQERFFELHYPEPNFKLGWSEQTHKRLVNEGPPCHLGQTYARLTEKYGDLIPRANAAALSFHERPPEGAGDPARDLSEDIRRRAAESGVDLVGFTRFERRYVTAEGKDSALFKNVIVLCRAFDWEATQILPSVDWDVHSYDTSLALTLAALEVAEFIRGQGFPVQFIAGTGMPGEKMLAPVLPYAVEAGLGQMGANGTMLTAEYGSRIRILALSTDAPVTYGKPVDLGINALCDACQICTNRCPGRALSRNRITWRGVTKYKVVAERCLPMLRYADCNVCTKVCPVQHHGLKPVLEYFEKTGKVLGKDDTNLQSYDFFEKGRFGPGQLPRFGAKEGGRGLKEMVRALEGDEKS